MKAKIKIHIANWSGWAKKQPAPLDLELTLGVDEFVRLSDHGAFGGSIAIYEVSSEWVKIRTSGLHSKEHKGEGLDPKENKLGVVFTIMLGKSIALKTVGVMDAGSTCEVTFLGVAVE